MRSFALFPGIVILALAFCVLGFDEIPNVNPEAYTQARSLMDELFPNWKAEVTQNPELLEDYETVQGVLEEAFAQKPAVEGTKIYQALRSRFIGQGAHLTRQQVVQEVGMMYDGMTVEGMGEASTAFLEAEASAEFTPELAGFTADAMLETVGLEAAEAGAFFAIDFEMTEILGLFLLCLL